MLRLLAIPLLLLAGSAVPTPCAYGQTCCKVCKAGKACGNTCIARDKVCRTGGGCACDG